MANDPLRTKLCDMLGIEFPICAFTHCKDVAVALINAGGFAVYGGSLHAPDELAPNIKWIRDRVEGRPFGVDLLLPATAAPSGTVEDLLAQIPEEHRKFVQGIRERHGIPNAKGPMEHSPGLANQEMARRQVDVILEERVPVFASGLGSPGFVVEAAHSRGMQVWGLVGKPRQARREIEAGVDVIIAQGTDAGGHTGDIGTFSIVPAVVSIAGDAPVLAAGGVTTGRHLAAALCLGAAGVWTGTIWLAARESDEDVVVKEKVIAATAEDTVRTRFLTGKTVRSLKTQWHVEWEAPGAPEPLPSPFQYLLWAEVRQAIKDYRIEPFMMPAGAGQGIGFVTSMKPVRQIVFDLVDEARAVFDGLLG
jgi:NAD(P)H-dependent flavin oxidoreductase YrpB (nitropropane dioxygenase family)